MKPEDLTIIIPHLGSTKEQKYSLAECINSLIDTCPFKIIVAFNGIDDKARIEPLLHPQVSNIIIQNQGQCKAVNAAVATTNTPWVMITNDDMVYAPGWWEKLTEIAGWVFMVSSSSKIETMDFKPYGFIPVDDVEEALPIKNFQCISPKLVEPRAGAPTFDVMFAGGAGGDFDKDKWLGYADEYMRSDHGELRTGFNLPLLMTRELWDTVGGYDINYDPWGSNSDSDLLYKIRLAGVQPVQNGKSIVYHFSQTSGTFEPKNDSYRFKNYAYFKEKWGFDRTDNRIWEADFIMPTPEEGRIFNPDYEGKYA